MVEIKYVYRPKPSPNFDIMRLCKCFHYNQILLNHLAFILFGFYLMKGIPEMRRAH